VLGVGLGKLIQWIIDVRPAPQRYQILLILTIAFYALSFVSVMLVKEERHDGLPTQDGKSWAGYFRDLGLILARQRDFRVFLIAAVLLTVPTAVMATFLTKYGLTSSGAGSGVAGTFTMFYFAAMAVGSLAGGLISDRKGVLVPFRVFPLFVAGGCAVSAVSPNWIVVSGAWALLGFAWGMRIVAFLPAVFSFAEPHRRPSYSSVLFTALGATAAVLPPLVGMVKDARVLDFPAIFVLCGAAALAGWYLLLRIGSPKAVPL
jgi:MFS family permease